MKKIGFTLAEVLITLGIIGIIAALTIPGLVANYQVKQTVVQLKKYYSVLSQVYAQAIAENGEPATWLYEGTSRREAGDNLINKLSAYLKVIKTCPYTDAASCFAGYRLNALGDVLSDDMTLSSSDWGGRSVLNDGTLLYIYAYDCAAEPERIHCTTVGVDLNGFKPPNAFGKDVFQFRFMRNGTVIPAGLPNVNLKGEVAFDGNCINITGTNQDGKYCAAWVLQNENMDYLKCNDLSWDSKTRCD